ncbi:UXT, putative [Babesia ovis]|uniref:UXT, putative n=1 Tax=Babesia ovis TaxID=5869 RepID=A0A9W5TBX8_BABOV|nr:UXT, putative [Babesia ovis]
MLKNDDSALEDADVIGVLRQQLPPQLQQVDSVESLLEFGITAAKAERDRAVTRVIRNKQLLANIKLLNKLEDGVKTYVDAGNNVFLPARLQDRKILVHIGYQFYIAMDHKEAERFVTERLKLLQRNVENLNAKVAEQRAQAFIIAETLCTMSTTEFGQ